MLYSEILKKEQQEIERHAEIIVEDELYQRGLISQLVFENND